LPFAVCAALGADVHDAIHHQHIWRRQLRVAFAEQLAAAALQ
jgi:hypothetical protein